MSSGMRGACGLAISAPTSASPPSVPIAIAARRARPLQRTRVRVPIAPYKPGGPPRAPRALQEGSAIVARRFMPALAPEFELVLMLDPETPDERREQIAAEARQRIESGGELKHDTAWGMRKMAYEIRQRTEADYRFFRFAAGGSLLLDELNHNLKIADGVLRFRIFKVDPRTPVVVPPPPSPLSSGRPERGGRRDGGSRGRDGGPGRSRGGADDEPVAAPVQPVEQPAAEDPGSPETPTAPPPEPEAPEAPEPQPETPAEQPAEAPAEDASGADDEQP